MSRQAKPARRSRTLLPVARLNARLGHNARVYSYLLIYHIQDKPAAATEYQCKRYSHGGYDARREMGPGRFPRSAGEMSRSDKRGRPACGVARRRSSAPVRWATRAMRCTSRLAGRLIGLRCPRLWCSADIIPYLCKKRKTKYTNVYRQKSR